MKFAKYLLIWVSQNLAVPFWTIGHIHLMTTVYDDITEIVSSVGMNIIVVAGIIVDYRDKKRDDSERKKEDDDIPICFI
jgi:uncharacterized membrane protein